MPGAGSNGGKNMDNLDLNSLLFNPDSFFSRKSKNEVSFKYPALILLVYSALAIASSLLVMNMFRESLSSDLGSSGSSFSSIAIFAGAAGGVLGGLIGTFLTWFILAGILYLISSLFHSTGSFKRTLEFVSYGFVPLIFSGFISFVVSYKLLSSVDFSSMGPQIMVQGIRQVFSNNPFYYTSQIIGILCALLSAYIWVFALLHARNMSIKNSSLTVGIPAGLYIVYLIYQLLFTSGSI